MEEPRYQIVKTVSALEKVVRTMRGEESIGVDLEADSMFHFKEKVCLIQLSTRHEIFVIDPLKVKDLSPLSPVFANRDMRKIFHGADYDVRSLFRDFNIVINNLFDTELASRFLGVSETGLNAIIQQRFSIHLDKKYQKKDWSQRPLPPGMMEYAAIDAAYLIPLSEMIEDELVEKGRLSWLQEECEYLSRVRAVSPHAKPLFLKFKGAGRLPRRDLAVLEALLLFRVKTAEKKDKPLYKIIGNSSLMKIAAARPKDFKGLDGLDILSGRQIDMYGREIVKIINKALQLDRSKLPKYPVKRAPYLKAGAVRTLKVLKKWRDGRAETLKINPSLLLNNAVLNGIASNRPASLRDFKTIKGIRKWQVEELGRDIVAVLQNENQAT